jgi:hypothetical protein
MYAVCPEVSDFMSRVAGVTQHRWSPETCCSSRILTRTHLHGEALGLWAEWGIAHLHSPALYLRSFLDGLTVNDWEIVARISRL